MTFSIVARCPRSGQLGVGAITAGIGVGKLVPHARARIGAIATQARVNPYLGIDGLAALASGADAARALRAVVDADPGRDRRQVAIVDARGGVAAWTGTRTLAWSGHVGGTGWSAQGNRLVGPETLEAVGTEYEARADCDLADRIVLALEAGERTGADLDGAVSGAVVVVDTEEYPLWDLRVDRSSDPAGALRALWRAAAESLIPEVVRLPTRADPLGAATRDDVERERAGGKTGLGAEDLRRS